MIKLNILLAAAISVPGVIATIDHELSFFANLLKRQEPGSAAYSCHEACGQAITQARSSEDVCSDDVFLDDYNSCLKCAGPENTDIWKYYGGTLSGIGEGCGLSTTPEGSESNDGESTTPAGSTSTGPVATQTSSSVINTTTTPTQSTVTPSGSSTTLETSTPAANGTASTTGIVQVPNAGNALLSNSYQFYGVAALGSLFAIAY
ncbi:hypothetical protein GQX73_g4450 [Xylaria multiplex]|uniref:WSC domain-containing protein n=1 Tax=Xylaria multiplex TaxID=323545 RepID=A0A7C8IPP7_9PEZI|nr:hypothetical protein GQX73_g4450 [Xylaria multiplex]